MIKKIFTNSAGILTSRILGFVRDLLTASILGANIYSDIFFVAFKLPNLFRRIFAEGAFTQAFLPSFIASKHKNLFALYIFIHFLSIILILSFFVTLFAPFFTKLLAFGFSDNLIQLAAPYVAINFYYLDLIFIVTFFAALLQYREHFATTAFATALLNISLIGALLLYQHATKESIVCALSIAVLIGGVLQVVVHLLAAKKRNILYKLFVASYFLKKKALIQKDLKKFYSNFFAAIFGNSTAQVAAFLDTWLASFLASGSISYLYYANRILQLPLALFAIATATALFPSISKALKKKDEELALQYLQKSFWLLTTLLTLSTLGAILLDKEIIALLFERGSFTHQDTLHTASVLSMYMVGLLPYGLSKLFALWLYAKHQQKKAAKIALYTLIVNILFSLLLLLPLQAAGLALASSIAGFVNLFFVLKEFGWQKLKNFFQTRIFLLFLSTILVETLFIEFFIKKLF